MSIYWLVLLQMLRFWWHSIFSPSKLVPVPFSWIVCGTEIRVIIRPGYSGHIHPVVPKPATQTLLWTELLHSDFRRAGWLSLESTLGCPLANSRPSHQRGCLLVNSHPGHQRGCLLVNSHPSHRRGCPLANSCPSNQRGCLVDNSCPGNQRGCPLANIHPS